MKVATLVVLGVLGLVTFVKAQKENNIWVGGDDVLIDFNSGVPVALPRTDDQNIWRTNAAICDSSGNLLFYTNGYRIYDKNFQIMLNGDDLNIGDYESWGYNQLAVHDGAAIVPVPDASDKYYVFHTDLNFTEFDTFANALMPTHLFYCLVDMSLDGGNGGVVAGQKDVMFFADTLTAGGFKIIKHGNGRDYWLLCHEAGTNRFYRFLVGSSGIDGPYEQHIGGELPSFNSMDRCVLSTSDDGSKVTLLHTLDNAVDYFQFNRCTGELYNPITFHVDDLGTSDTLYYLMGSGFSPNGRYLYVSAHLWYRVYQFDLQATDISSSRFLVAEYSGALNPFETDYDKFGLGPDGKIYISTFGGNRSLHIIHQPDSAGSACDFEDNGLSINPPGKNWSSVPNTVNYSLGPAYGSGCDTVTKAHDLPSPTFTFGVYPNPFSSELQLTITGALTKANVEVTNPLGQSLFTRTFTPEDFSIRTTIDVSLFPTGIYLVTLTLNGERHSAQKLREE